MTVITSGKNIFNSDYNEALGCPSWCEYNNDTNCWRDAD